LNSDLPFTRNALCYAKAAIGIVQHGFNIPAVANSFEWASGKPIFFSALAAPFTAAFGAAAGTLIASAAGTMFFLWMTTLALPRLNRLAGVTQDALPLEFLLVILNPLVIYQFWSAYPDSLFAGLVLAAFILCDTIASEPRRDTRWHIVGLGFVIYFAIHTKLYGAVLCLACPAYLLVYENPRKVLSRYGVSKIVTLGCVLSALLLVVVAAKLGINPLLALTDGGGYGGFSGADLPGAVEMFVFAILLSFHAALALLLRPHTWRAWKLASTVFAALYLLPLFPFDGTNINMRYFLPLFPFVAVPLAAGAVSVRARTRWSILSVYAVVAVALTLIFNLRQAEQPFDRLISNLSSRHERIAFWLDNLRLPVQLRFRRELDSINAVVPSGKTFYWASDYYGPASHGLAGVLGIKSDLDIHYVSYPSEIGPPPDPVYVMEYDVDEASAGLGQIPDWATAHSVGDHLFRLDPIALQLRSSPAGPIGNDIPVRLRALVLHGEQFKPRIKSVEFLEGNRSLGAATEGDRLERVWQEPGPGRHEVTARLVYGENETIYSKPIILYVGVNGIERLADSANSLAVETDDRWVASAANTLELGWHREMPASSTGIYLSGLPIHSGARIRRAYLQFAVARADFEPAHLTIQAEKSPDAVPPVFTRSNLSRRPRTAAIVSWRPEAWRNIGGYERSPDLAPLLRELIAQPGWRPDSGLMFFIQGTGRRVAKAHEADANAAPRLYVELESPD